MGDIIIQVIILAVSSFYIAVGLRILLAKRPFIVSRLWRLIIGFATMIVISITTLWPRYPGQSWLRAFLAVGRMAIFSGMTLWSSNGGVFIGVTGTTLRDALRHALRRLILSYEESAKAFRSLTLNNELIAEATLIDGMFFLRLIRLGNRHAIRQLAAGVNGFFRTAPVRTNKRVSYALVVIGATLLLFDSWVTYERLSLRA